MECLDAFRFSTLEADLEQRFTSPWAFFAQNSDGSILGLVSPHFLGGLFWSISNGQLLVSDSLESVVGARCGPTEIDREFIRAVAMRRRDITTSSTPFRQVHTLAPGTRLRWELGSINPRCTRVVGSDAWGQAHIQGESTIELYRRTFDTAVDSLLVPGQLMCATLSGGLDSTFMVASLARHATPENPIHAYCHSPHPDAVCEVKPNWDPDDFAMAQEMVKAYPGQIVLHRLVATEVDNPLDAAARKAEKSWFPSPTPANQMWLQQASQSAADLGASRLFIGRNGNAAFSYSHDYAFGHYMKKLKLLSAFRSIHTGEPMVQPGTNKFRARVISPLASQLRSRARRHQNNYLPLVGLGHESPLEAPIENREYYLAWLAGDIQSPIGSTLSSWPAPLVDPYSDPRILSLAAAITPLEWSRGPQPRGYARLLGQGRVPDSIRLRTRQGGQSMDQWYFMRNHRDRYYDETSMLAQTPILGDWVDHVALQRRLDTWPWGQRDSPPLLQLVAMNSILSLGAYVRMVLSGDVGVVAEAVSE